MAEKRPYIFTLGGKPRMIEAISPSAVVRFALGADLTELRPATGKEVTGWIRAGKTIEDSTAPAAAPTAAPTPAADPNAAVVMGVDFSVEPDTVTSAGISFAADGFKVDDASWTADDAWKWVSEQPMVDGIADKFNPRMCWKAMQRDGKMDVEDFDAMREAIPTFAEALAWDTPLPPLAKGEKRSQQSEGPNVAGFRETLLKNGPKGMSFDVVVAAIGEQKRRELYVTGESAPAEPEADTTAAG